MGKVKVINNRNDLVVDNYDDTRCRHTQSDTRCRHHDFFSEKIVESATLDCVETGALPLVNTLATHAATMIFLRKIMESATLDCVEIGALPLPAHAAGHASPGAAPLFRNATVADSKI